MSRIVTALVFCMSSFRLFAQQIDKTAPARDLADLRDATRAEHTDKLKLIQGAENILRGKVGPDAGDDPTAEAPFIQLHLMACLVQGDYSRQVSKIYARAADAAAAAAKELDVKAEAPAASAPEAVEARQNLEEATRRDAELKAKPALTGVEKAELEGLPAFENQLRDTVALALGIGANATLFSVVNGVLLNPLPYPQPEQLVTLFGSTPGYEQGPIVYLNFLDWERDNRTFSSLGAFRNQDYNLTEPTESERVTGDQISAGFFPTLGIHPVLGRAFRADDDRLGAAPVVLLGGGFWARKFGSSPAVIGQGLTLNGLLYTIVGVIPEGFTFYGHDRDVYTPIGQWTDPSFRDRRISVSARSIGRLKPGVTLAQAQSDMDAVARSLAEAFPVADRNTGVQLVSMKEDILGNVKPLLIVLLAAVGFLLLIACANVANLFLARSMGRSREFAIRAALGASRARVVRQLLTESLLLATAGGALGLAAGAAGLRAALRTLPGSIPRTEGIRLDARVALFTLALSLVTAILFGLAPMFRGARTPVVEVLKQGARGSTAARHYLQRAFVAIQVAMSLVLLIGAGLMLRSVAALWRVDLGFRPAHAITFNLAMPATPSTTSAETRARLRRFDDALRPIPGVDAVSVTLGTRPMIHDSFLPFWVKGRPKPANENEMPQAMFFLVEGGFDSAMGLTLQRGRFVNEQDNENTPVVIDIDDAMARTVFPHEDPVGKRIHIQQFAVEAEIVGVVAHVKQWGPGGDKPSAIQAQFFYPFMQMPEDLMRLSANAVAVVLRTTGDPGAAMAPIRAAVKQVDSRQIIYNVQTLDDVVAGSLAPRRLAMLLLTIFSSLALALACVGVYGVIAYLAGQRTHEIGVRMALGAQPIDVLRLILAEGAKMTLLGVIVGVAGALALTRFMAGQLYGVTAQDPLTFTAVGVVVSVVAMAACYLPARWAMRVDPLTALNSE